MDLRRNRDARHRGRRRVFVGSCTNGRIEDLRVVAEVHHAWPQSGVRMLIVPGSMRYARELARGSVNLSPTRAQWRQAGCSVCVTGRFGISWRRGALRHDVQATTEGRGRGREAALHVWCPQQWRPPPQFAALSSPADLN